MQVQYKGYQIALASQKLASGRWSPWARVGLDYKGKIIFTSIQSKGPMGFKTQREADSCALALAKKWIDHRTR